MNDLYYAMSKLRRGKLVECVSICDKELEKNPRDQTAWYVPSISYHLCPVTIKTWNLCFLKDLKVCSTCKGDLRR